MRFICLWIMLAGAGTTLYSCAGRQDVTREINSYTPPVLYQSAAAAPLHREPVDIALEDKVFFDQKEKLEKLRKNWEKSISSPLEKTSFFTPDPKRLKMVSHAFIDDMVAKDLLSGEFFLEDLEILVFGRNPSIKNAKKNVQATLEAYTQASVLDDIIRSYSAFNAGNMTGVGNMEDMESIYKKFPFPGILSLKGDIVQQEIKIAMMDLEIINRTIITEARKNYQELVFNNQAKEIARRTLRLLEELESSVIRRYETGRAMIPELARVKIQKEKMKVELLTIFEQGLTIEKQLKSLLLLPDYVRIGKPVIPDEKLLFPAGVDLHLPDWIKTALKHRQELEKIRIMTTRMELMIEMAETQIYPGGVPNLALTENRAVTGAGTIRMEEPFAVSVFASMGAGLPKMPWTGLSESYLRETRLRLSALKEELRAKEAQTEADVRQAWFFADRAHREAALYSEEIRSLTLLNFAVSTIAYENGSVSFFEAMDEVLLMFETKLMMERKKADFFISLADLYSTTGISSQARLIKERDQKDAQ